MASHHHHSHPPPQTTTACCCNFCHCCSPPPPRLSPPLPDPLLQALAAHILQSVPPSHHHDPYPQSTKLDTHNLRTQSQYQHQHHQRRSQNPRFQEIPGTHSLLSSLIRRIDALESSLHHFSVSSSPSSYKCPPYSLRDFAARVIQTHFRAFLVRRSRTLSLLKDLALVKSTFNSLKSSLSRETRFDVDALSQEVMDLLLRLDSIQGGDPMIRDGKRSLSRDLGRFLEFLDEVAVERHGLSLKTVKNVSFGHPNVNKSRVLATKIRSLGGQREMLEKLRARVENISGFSRVCQNDEEDVELEGFQHASDNDEENPRIVVSRNTGQIRNGVLVKRNEVQSRVKKSVSFAENGNMFRVFSNRHDHEPISSGDGTCLDESVSSDDQGEPVDILCSEAEEVKGFPQGTEDDEKAHWENGASPQTSDGERNYEIREHSQDHNRGYAFSAPLPVRMESQADSMKRRKALKIVT